MRRKRSLRALIVARAWRKHIRFSRSSSAGAAVMNSHDAFCWAPGCALDTRSGHDWYAARRRKKLEQKQKLKTSGTSFAPAFLRQKVEPYLISKPRTCKTRFGRWRRQSCKKRIRPWRPLCNEWKQTGRCAWERVIMWLMSRRWKMRIFNLHGGARCASWTNEMPKNAQRCTNIDFHYNWFSLDGVQSRIYNIFLWKQPFEDGTGHACHRQKHFRAHVACGHFDESGAWKCAKFRDNVFKISSRSVCEKRPLAEHRGAWNFW